MSEVITIVCANISQASDYMHEEIENRLSTGNAYCHLVQNLLSSGKRHSC